LNMSIIGCRIFPQFSSSTEYYCFTLILRLPAIIMRKYLSCYFPASYFSASIETLCHSVHPTYSFTLSNARWSYTSRGECCHSMC
jgi:hypothetical protein